VPVVLESSQPGPSVSLYLDRKCEQPVAYCPNRCLVYVPPRKYWLEVGESQETLAGRRNVNIDGPSRLVVDPRAKSERSMGLVMGVTGIALLVTGTVVMLGALESSDHPDGNDDINLVALGFVGFTAGAILTPIGWVRYGRSAPGVQTEPLVPGPTP
jgi:hypothetical protein